MAQNIALMGATYSNVPAVNLPKASGGTARFTDVTDSTVTANTMVSGTVGYNSAGTQVTGTLVIKRYYYGTSDPVASALNDGDIYLKVVN